MSARILDVCDAVAAALTTEIGGPPGDPAATVERVYQADIETRSLTGRKVYVMPGSYAGVERPTRGERSQDNTVTVLVVERYTDQGPPPNDWLDERVEWVEETVFDLLDDEADVPAAILALGNVWPQTSEVLVFDQEMLREKNLFFSVVGITYREIE